MQSTQRKTEQTSHTTQKMLEKMGLVTILLRDKLFRLTGATLGKIKTLKSTERTFKWKFQGTFVVCENTEVSQLKRVRQIHVQSQRNVGSFSGSLIKLMPGKITQNCFAHQTTVNNSWHFAVTVMC